MFRILLILLFTLVANAKDSNLEFLPNEMGKILILDKNMQIKEVISVKKGQSGIKLPLKSSNFYISFVENTEAKKDSQENLSKNLAENLEGGILNADFKDIKKQSSFLGFSPYRQNYILPISTNLDKQSTHKNQTEAKFQISLETLLYENLFIKRLNLYFTYTQQSFWQVYDANNSRPFRESNYEPALFLSYPLDFKHFKGVNFGYIHQSNGGGISNSRSWDRLFIEGISEFDNFNIALKAWWRIPEKESKDDNSDIVDYLGYGELRIGYILDEHHLNLTLRNNLKSDNKGAIMLEYSYPLLEHLYFFMQYFNGYGESLIDYNRKIERFGVGVAFTR